MTRLIGAVLAAALAHSAPAPSSTADEAVVRLQREMSAASERGDRATLERHLAPEFTLMFVSSRKPAPSFLSRTDALERWSRPGGGGQSLVAEQRAVAAGGVVVVFAKITDTWIEDGKERRAVTRVSDTWIQRGGRWLWLASHESLVD